MNEDNTHYFGTRAEQKLNDKKVDSWVDQYANTQVKELMRYFPMAFNTYE